MHHCPLIPTLVEDSPNRNCVRLHEPKLALEKFQPEHWACDGTVQEPDLHPLLRDLCSMPVNLLYANQAIPLDRKTLPDQ